MSDELKFIVPGAKEEERLKMLVREGYAFSERVTESHFKPIGMRPIPIRNYQVMFVTPDEMTYEKICDASWDNKYKKDLTRAVLSTAWKHLEDAEKLRKYELYISEVSDYRDTLKEYFHQHNSPLYKALSTVVNGAQKILRYRMKS